MSGVQEEGVVVEHLIIPVVYMLLEFACAVAMALRFRGSLGGILGSVGFATKGLVRLCFLLLFPPLGAVTTGGWRVALSTQLSLVTLVGFGLVLAGICTARTQGIEAGPPSIGPRN